MSDNNNSIYFEANDDDFEQRFHQSLMINGLIFPNKAKEFDHFRSILLTNVPSNMPSALDIINTGLIKIKAQPQSIPDTYSSWSYLFHRLAKLDLKKDFVVSRLLPNFLAKSINLISTDLVLTKELVIQAATYVEDLLGIERNTILSDQEFHLNLIPARSARYKLPANIDAHKMTAYTIYVHRLATILLEATQSLTIRVIPTQFTDFRSEILERYGDINFETTLHYTWYLGIPVLPLTDTARFHGACWRINGRNVIVLKQKTKSSLRWLFDLIHEVRHAAQHPEQNSFAVLEDADDVNRQMSLSAEEKDANIFAGQVLLKGKAIQLANEVIDLADGKTERLKTAAIKVANREGIQPGTLANYLAFQLMAQQNMPWWGAAMNLQPQESAPWHLAQDVFWQYIDKSKLDERAHNLLVSALQ